MNILVGVITYNENDKNITARLNNNNAQLQTTYFRKHPYITDTAHATENYS